MPKKTTKKPSAKKTTKSTPAEPAKKATVKKKLAPKKVEPVEEIQETKTPLVSGQGPLSEEENQICCEKKSFNLGKLLFGITLISLGFVYLAKNAGWFEIDINILSLWPLLIIFLGLSMITTKNWFTATLSFIFTFVVIAVVIAALILGLDNKDTKKYYLNINKIQTNSAEIFIDSGAGKIKIDGNGQKLVEGQLNSNFAKLKAETSTTDRLQTVNIEAEANGNWLNWFGRENDLDLNMNPDTPMKIFVESGASKMSFDLREVMLQELVVDTGASSLDLQLGDKIENQKIKIDAGASSIEITVPENVSVKINLDGGLISKNLDGFDKIDDDTYKSKGYDENGKKIDIELDLGVSSLNVDRR